MIKNIKIHCGTQIIYVGHKNILFAFSYKGLKTHVFLKVQLALAISTKSPSLTRHYSKLEEVE